MSLTLVCVVWFVVACVGGPIFGRLLALNSDNAGDFDLAASPRAADAPGSSTIERDPGAFLYVDTDVPAGMTLSDWRHR